MIFANVVVRTLRRLTVILLFTALARSAPFLLANADAYTPAAIEWVAYGLLIAVTAAVAALNAGSRPMRVRRGALTVVVLTASVLATAAVPADLLFTSAHWSWFVVGWFLVAIHVDDGFALLAWMLAVNLVLVVGQGLLAGPLDRQDVAELIIRGTVFTGAQLAFGMATLVIGRADRLASVVRGREAEAVTGQRIADELMRQRRERHAAISSTAVPLLRGLAGGVLDPDDPAVRRSAMVEATRLRRLMAEADQAPNPLHHELRACIDVAERAGVEVDVAFRGSAPSLDVAARRRLTEPVIAVLAGATGSARVTVVGTGRDVVVSVLAETAEDVPPERFGDSGRDVDVKVVRSPGRIWITSRWEAT